MDRPSKHCKASSIWIWELLPRLKVEKMLYREWACLIPFLTPYKAVSSTGLQNSHYAKSPHIPHKLHESPSTGTCNPLLFCILLWSKTCSRHLQGAQKMKESAAMGWLMIVASLATLCSFGVAQ